MAEPRTDRARRHREMVVDLVMRSSQAEVARNLGISRQRVSEIVRYWREDERRQAEEAADAIQRDEDHRRRIEAWKAYRRRVEGFYAVVEWFRQRGGAEAFAAFGGQQ
jgi:hypothetical protein